MLPSGSVPEIDDALFVTPLLPPHADAPLQLQLAVTVLLCVKDIVWWYWTWVTLLPQCPPTLLGAAVVTVVPAQLSSISSKDSLCILSEALGDLKNCCMLKLSTMLRSRKVVWLDEDLKFTKGLLWFCCGDKENEVVGDVCVPAALCRSTLRLDTPEDFRFCTDNCWNCFWLNDGIDNQKSTVFG